MNGIINIFKPKGCTSHQVVNHIRKLIQLKQVGHTGTLDPEVTGVLPICIGKATRISEYIMEQGKEYFGEITLGVATDSHDYAGQVIAQSSVNVDEKDIQRVFTSWNNSFREQIPPMCSAVRHQGKKLYEYAREGKIVERKARMIHIYQLIPVNYDQNKILFSCHCSKGTYMRTLAHDIGLELGSYGYLSMLIRTRSGAFTLNNALDLDYLSNLSREEMEELLIPIDQCLYQFPSLSVPDEDFQKLINGVRIPFTAQASADADYYKIYCRKQFIGLGSIVREPGKSAILKMKKVFV